MRILAFNCGSSSIKCRLVGDTAPGFELRVEGIGGEQARLVIDGAERPLPGEPDAAAAVDAALAALREHWPRLGELDAVVHRVVHGGERFTAPIRVTDEVLAQLAGLEALAPLHNPPAIRALRGAAALF